MSVREKIKGKKLMDKGGNMKEIYDFLRKYGSLPLGIVLMAFALKGFFEPFNIVSGGVTGLAIIIEDIVGIPLWISNLVINLPLFVWAYLVFNRGFVIRAAGAELFFTFLLYVMEDFKGVESDFVTSAVFGGTIYGLGIGLVLRTGTTTGGTDLTASIINRLLPYIKIPAAMMVLDMAVILTGFGVFGAVRAMYGIIAVAVMSKASDFVLEGLNFAKAAFIISDRGGEMGRAITGELDRGATLIEARGVYSGRERQMIVVAASRRQIPALRAICRRVDPGSFMFVTDIREIIGKFRS